MRGGERETEKGRIDLRVRVCVERERQSERRGGGVKESNISPVT